MVKGLDIFEKYFAEYADQYVLIGGAACDIIFSKNDAQFRATRDLDMVLIMGQSFFSWDCHHVMY